MTEAAFEQVAEKLRDKAMATAKACGMGEMQADDIAQDVMLKLWTIRHELDRYRSLDGVTVVMTRHLITDQWRRSRTVQLPNEANAMVANNATPSERIEEIENDAWLKRRIDQLPNKQRCVLIMRQVEHREYEEIARLLGISTTSARTLIARARKSLLEDFKRRMK